MEANKTNADREDGEYAAAHRDGGRGDAHRSEDTETYGNKNGAGDGDTKELSAEAASANQKATGGEETDEDRDVNGHRRSVSTLRTN